MYTLKASWCSVRLSRAQVQASAGSSVRDSPPKKKKGEEVRGRKLGGSKGGGSKGGGSKGEPPALVGTMEYNQSDRNR